MSHSHFDKFSKKGGKCPIVSLTSFQKMRKMSQSFWQNFKERRKMSLGLFDKFSKKGRKCPLVILTNFLKKRRKMSQNHFDKVLWNGGKCSIVILTSFQKKEENVLRSFWQTFIKRRKMFQKHFHNFRKKEENVLPSFWHVFPKGGKCPIVIQTHFQKRRKMFIGHLDPKKEDNVHWSLWPSLRNGRKLSLLPFWTFFRHGRKILLKWQWEN